MALHQKLKAGVPRESFVQDYLIEPLQKGYSARKSFLGIQPSIIARKKKVTG